MSETRKSLARPDLCEEAKAHFNEPMLLGPKLARCIGYGEDERDCYIIARYFRGEEVWHTFVGGYTWLTLLARQGRVISKSGEEWNDLTRLDGLLDCNGSPREAAFIVKADY